MAVHGLFLPGRCVWLAALRQHRFQQDQERQLAGSLWQDHDLVFPTTRGTPTPNEHISMRFHAALKRAELPRMRFHDLRHSRASLLLAQNVPPKVVQSILGHSTIVITMDLYGHLMPDAGREAASIMDALLKRKASMLAISDDTTEETGS